ncbi:hypothetical protein EJB05_29604 [Eragrostis curvula]|uniref:Uncharacterized protein n=1 Tax=Eragrostis curvula TaxID=38414 RepID=A0A5J9UTS2_9POAL|nr:hypothetical protein EJB05_29604 [Eragrostis curvula]
MCVETLHTHVLAPCIPLISCSSSHLNSLITSCLRLTVRAAAHLPLRPSVRPSRSASPRRKKFVMDVIETEEELRLALADMKKRHSFLAVLLTSLSALVSAYFLGRLSAENLFLPISHQQCSEFKTCYELKSSAADEANAILYALLCCSVLQAAAAVLALLLTGRRRRALAYFTLAATVVGHCMYARIQCPRLDAYRNIDGVRLTILFFNLGNDLLCFHLLIKI